jgi:hypothetical protein
VHKPALNGCSILAFVIPASAVALLVSTPDGGALVAVT